MRFDFNPLNLRSPTAEMVATFIDIARDPATSPNTIGIVAPSLNEANALAARLKALPEVERAITLSSFVPADQDAKLDQIRDLAVLLGPSLYPSELKPAPTDAETVEAMKSAAADLADAANTHPGPGADAAKRLASSLSALAAGPPERRARAEREMLPGAAHIVEQTRQLIQAAPVTLADLPPEIARRLGHEGRAVARRSLRQGGFQ